jgi:hypothetical protein
MNTKLYAGENYTRSHSVDQTAEAQRVRAIEAFAATTAPAGYRAIIDAAIADGRSQPADVAQAIIEQIRSEHSQAANALAAALPQAHADAGFPDLEAIQAAALQTWRSNTALRAEFAGDQSSYLAYRKAEALGRVRIPGKQGR